MGYTEEEMHELEILAHLEEKDFNHNTCDNSYIDLVMNAGKKAFKIINKQQKEIERLERINKDYDLIYTKQYEYIQDSISKKVIRKKIEELKDKEQELTDEQGYWGDSSIQHKIEILTELLDE